MTVSEIDIWRAAMLTIDGPGAWIHAAKQVGAMNIVGDLDGAAVWKRIADTIAKLDDMEASDEVH